jgi:hypothetical protein
MNRNVVMLVLAVQMFTTLGADVFAVVVCVANVRHFVRWFVD